MNQNTNQIKEFVSKFLLTNMREFPAITHTIQFFDIIKYNNIEYNFDTLCLQLWDIVTDNYGTHLSLYELHDLLKSNSLTKTRQLFDRINNKYV